MDEIQDEDGYICATCEEDTDFSELKQCRICETGVCVKCYDENNKLNYTEWLYGCSNKCIACNMIGCKDCINLCYQCANLSEGNDSYCVKCKIFDTIKCRCGEEWPVCDKHKDIECPTCEANQNYSLKHSYN